MIHKHWIGKVTQNSRHTTVCFKASKTQTVENNVLSYKNSHRERDIKTCLHKTYPTESYRRKFSTLSTFRGVFGVVGLRCWGFLPQGAGTAARPRLFPRLPRRAPCTARRRSSGGTARSRRGGSPPAIPQAKWFFRTGKTPFSTVPAHDSPSGGGVTFSELPTALFVGLDAVTIISDALLYVEAEGVAVALAHSEW